jgi:hypothetical protein
MEIFELPFGVLTAFRSGIRISFHTSQLISQDLVSAYVLNSAILAFYLKRLPWIAPMRPQPEAARKKRGARVQRPRISFFFF